MDVDSPSQHNSDDDRMEIDDEDCDELMIDAKTMSSFNLSENEETGSCEPKPKDRAQTHLQSKFNNPP